MPRFGGIRFTGTPYPKSGEVRGQFGKLGALIYFHAGEYIVEKQAAPQRYTLVRHLNIYFVVQR